MADWANMPRELLGGILRAVGDNPLRFAGVCKGWRWVLDDASFRRSVIFDYTSIRGHSLYDALRSFSAFMCSRPAATVQLDVYVDVCDPAPSACMACACLGAVLVHLAPTLRELAVQPSGLSGAIVGSHFTDACPRLEYLRAHVASDLDLGRVSSLRRVELTFTGAHVDAVVLPPGIRSCRCEVLDPAPSFVLTSLVAQLQLMPELYTLDICSDYECPLDVAKLSPLLTTLVVRTQVLSEVSFAGASCTNLEVLSLHKARLAAADLIDLLVSCRGLKALACTDYFFHDLVHPFADLRHLPLRAVALVTNIYASRLRCLLPRGVRVLTVGPEDLGDAVQQARVQASVETLRLADMKYLASTVLQEVWPDHTQFARLSNLHVGACESVRMAALLGQRCPGAIMYFESAFTYDVELDLDLLHE